MVSCVVKYGVYFPQIKLNSSVLIFLIISFGGIKSSSRKVIFEMAKVFIISILPKMLNFLFFHMSSVFSKLQLRS